MEAVIIVGLAVLLGLHLAGGHHRARQARRHGLRPHLGYYGWGWWGSVDVAGFRIGHRIHPVHWVMAAVALVIGLVVLAHG